ncbi:tRNA lysidine(34) synthetase TilS [Corynebacterium tapiri]|uniref:tRNA(Ile)-lysidine synthase n=1 Tax=Corynebacterium tapiri TaxID=1448266 RepID=A0A5C4U3D7_9CORY|nr:tRNA lysidine(34) synthetase TilS [Corynebacterium tapiri]TNL96118.1 tRNA lysidine(34) synthetase TilS [Corynebacterium tapiri]
MDYPRVSPHFLACRRSVRPLRPAHPDVVVGLSGGADSLALVAACVAEKFAVHAVVVDHQLQEGSAAVAERAAEQARDLGASAQVIAVDVVDDGVGMEAAAREARYAALREVAGQRPVLVAHTANDQAETLLLGLLRGRAVGMSAASGQILRPFLQIRRADTEGACRELGLAWWSDPHNNNPAFARVAVRTRVIPELERILGGDAVAPLALAAERAAADEALLAGWADGPTDDARELASLPEPVRRRQIVAWLQAHTLRVSDGVVRGIDKLVSARGTGGVAAGKVGGTRLEVRVIDGRLTVVRQEQERRV